jgi:hypothetical protein
VLYCLNPSSATEAQTTISKHGAPDTHLHCHSKARTKHDLHAANVTLGAISYDDLRWLDGAFGVELCSYQLPQFIITQGLSIPVDASLLRVDVHSGCAPCMPMLLAM